MNILCNLFHKNTFIFKGLTKTGSDSHHTYAYAPLIYTSSDQKPLPEIWEEYHHCDTGSNLCVQHILVLVPTQGVVYCTIKSYNSQLRHF